MSDSGEAIVNGLPYIQAFRAFDEVVSKCFGVTVNEGYKEAIDQFRTAYLALGYPKGIEYMNICKKN